MRGNNPCFPVSRLVSIENTHAQCGGKVLPIGYVDELATLAQVPETAEVVFFARALAPCLGFLVTLRLGRQAIILQHSNTSTGTWDETTTIFAPTFGRFCACFGFFLAHVDVLHVCVLEVGRKSCPPSVCVALRSHPRMCAHERKPRQHGDAVSAETHATHVSQCLKRTRTRWRKRLGDKSSKPLAA